MAKKIEPIERQALTPNANIRPAQTAATLGEATAQLGQLASDILKTGSVYYSGLAGAEEGAAGTAPKVLLPPVGEASVAYNNAVLKAESRKLTNQARDMILQTYTELSNPATFNAQTPAQFNARVTGIAEGILENTRPELRESVKAQIEEYAAVAKLKMVGESINYDNKKIELDFNEEKNKAQNQLSEALYSYATNKSEANKKLVELAQYNLASVLDDYSQINQQIMDKLPEITREINEQVKVDMVVGEFLQSYNEGKEVQFLDNLTKNKPEGFTQAEYLKAMQKVLQIENSLQSAEQRYNQEQYYKAHYEIQTNQINSLDELKQQYGNKVPAATFYSLSEALFNKKKTEDSIYTVEATRRYGAQEVAKLPNKVLNDYYVEKEKQLVQEFNSNLPEGATPIARLNLAQRAERIVLPAGAPIQDFLTDLSYGLKSANPETAMDALNAYRVLFQNQGNFGDTLKGLDSDADDIAQYVLAIGDTSEADLFNLITTAQNNVNDRKDATFVARRDRLQKFYTLKDGVNIIQSTYKKAYGVTPNTPNNDAHFGTFQKLFDNYFMGVANGSDTIAVKMAQNALRDWGTSRFGEKDNYMYAPPDLSVPFANVGYWMDNQVGEALNNLLAGLEQLESGYARPKWMVDVSINESTTDDQIMGTKYYPKYSALVNGIEREIYIQSSKNTRTTSFPGEIFQFYYLDDYGVKQFLPDPNNTLSAGTWIAQQMYEYVPQAYNAIKDETLDQVARETFDRENKFQTNAQGETNIPIGADVATFGSASLAAKREPTEAELNAIKERLRRAGKKELIFKNGKLVEASEQTAAQQVIDTITMIEAPTPNVSINPDEIGRRKKK